MAQFRPEPFRIEVPESELADLRLRLARARLPLAPRDNEDWSHGPHAGYMGRLLRYWRDDFDWRRQEALLNRWSHFRVELPDAQGDVHRVHYLFEPGSGARPEPLILTHGWPSTWREYHEVVERLAHPERFGGDPEEGCDVIVPSLVGYGFSSRPERALGPSAIAELWHALMTRALGYPRFTAQAGDWGSLVTSQLALRHPECLRGIHLTLLPLRPDLAHPSQPPLSPEEQRWRAGLRAWWGPQAGYRAIQSTRPQALAYGLADSPIGLAAWLADKYWSLGDTRKEHPTEGMEQRFPFDQILSQISIYWFTRTIESANALYKAVQPGEAQLPPGVRVEVPTGYADYPIGGLPRVPRSWAERSYAIAHFAEQPRGGHFAAMEEPELFAADLQRFLRALR